MLNNSGTDITCFQNGESVLEDSDITDVQFKDGFVTYYDSNKKKVQFLIGTCSVLVQG